ncbi:hypothetical protein Tco_1410382 [Tanacetum coccineum]
MNQTPKQKEVRQVIFENNLCLGAILESHVANSNLQKMCSKVFKQWQWTSNGLMCYKGSRIILGRNPNIVNVVVISFDAQVMHACVYFKADKKELFCSFVYAHNRYIQRRDLWTNLVTYKNYIQNRPWCILGDFNVSLNADEKSTGLSYIDTGMRDFQECVEAIEVSDVNSTGLRFTWNQKPKGNDGILKKIDCIMANRIQHVFCGSYEWLGFWMFKVVKRLKMLKKLLRKLLYDHRNLHENVNKLWLELDKVQTTLDLDPSNLELREEEASYLQAFIDASLLEEKFLLKKAKVEWLKLGDANTTYFHKVVKSQATRNHIDCVTTTNGVSVDGDQVLLAFIDHYAEFLSQQGVTSNFNIIDQFCKQLSSDVANHMIRDVSDQEIREVMFVMGDNKAPGPDGYTAAFFKEAWDIIATDVTKVIKEFFITGVRLKEPNHTILALIPEDHFESDEGLLSGVGTPRCAFKVDIQKAYDTFDWNFFHAVLIGFGFHSRMIGWIMECVTFTSFSLSTNGSLHGYFKGKRGLRQGDLMSPYLFTLVMEVLTLMFHRKARVSRSFTYHRYYSKLNLINFCFADDLFLFAHGDVDSARVIMDMLVEFKEASRLTPSLPKSTPYFCNVLNYTKLDILNILPFEEVRAIDAEISLVSRRDEERSHYGSNGFIPINSMAALFRKFLFGERCHGDGRKSFSAGYNRSAKVKDIIVNTSWSWLDAWMSKYPNLGTIDVPHLTNTNDRLEWKDLSNMGVEFSVANVWDCICPRSDKEQLKCFTRIPNTPSSLDAIVYFLLLLAKMRSARSVISKLVFTSSCYFIWQERNRRLFMKTKRSQDQVIDVIKYTIRLKLLSCRFKKTPRVQMLCHLWELLTSRIHG